MSVLYKIKSSMHERTIAEFVISNKHLVIWIRMLKNQGEITKTSAASGSDSKQLGYKGLPAFKVELAKKKIVQDEVETFFNPRIL